MSTEQIALSLGQVIALGSFLFWLSKRSADKIDQALLQIARIERDIAFVRADHDRIISMDERLKTAEKDINSVYPKIRDIQGRIEDHGRNQ